MLNRSLGAFSLALKLLIEKTLNRNTTILGGKKCKKKNVHQHEVVLLAI